MTKSSIRRFLIRCLLPVSILPAVSCSPKLIVSDMADVVITDSPDAADSHCFVFKAGRRELSGFMVTRDDTLPLPGGTSEEGVRVIGSTYFGMMLFDITVTAGSYKMNSCADFLDRKPVAAFLASRLRSEFL